MAQKIGSFDTGHSGPLHDANLDYYGKRLVTASADCSLRFWDVSCETARFLSEIRVHDGPIWQVSWAHPQFGSVIASGSFDKKVIIWKETAAESGDWRMIHSSEEHCGSVNAVSFCPWEFGLMLASGSSDGSVAVLTHNSSSQSWSRKAFEAHVNGVNAIAWAPATPQIRVDGSSSAGAPRLASAGCDNTVRVWALDAYSNDWVETHKLGADDEGHTDWVRHVAWRPFMGLSSDCLASGSEDGRVIIWTQETPQSSRWGICQVLEFKEAVWRVSWSATGSVLAVASGEKSVTLFKELLDGRWAQLTDGPPALSSPTPSETVQDAAASTAAVGAN